MTGRFRSLLLFSFAVAVAACGRNEVVVPGTYSIDWDETRSRLMNAFPAPEESVRMLRMLAVSFGSGDFELHLRADHEFEVRSLEEPRSEEPRMRGTWVLAEGRIELEPESADHGATHFVIVDGGLLFTGKAPNEPGYVFFQRH